jgi:tight adherence protein B
MTLLNRKKAAEEFKKMHLELTFGLAIDVIFKRFSERIKLEEITYLTASLTILNKTGGNIIKVFSSIEKSLFNKKRLKLELASLTGSSKIIAYVLFILPFLFALVITLIDPTYFAVLYTNTLGYILLGIIVLMYITYIYFIRKIMKVRM